jgi:hypothetical protein
MIRRLGLTACLLLAAAMPALAQIHSGSHDGAYPHGPGHVRPEDATHALMHTLLHGSWTGTLSTQQGVSRGLDMSITQDSRRNVMLTMRAQQPIQVGTATNLMVNGDKLQWIQSLGGASCKATGVFSANTATAPDAIKGKMLCGDGEMTFSLRKKTG